MLIRLEVQSADGGKYLWQSDKALITIGRDGGCDLQLTGDKAGVVSTKHAQIRCSGGKATVCDTGSTNGTFVDDEPISAEVPLKKGSVIRIAMDAFTLKVIGIECEDQRSPPREPPPGPISPVPSPFLEKGRRPSVSPSDGEVKVPNFPSGSERKPTRQFVYDLMAKQRRWFFATVGLLLALAVLLVGIIWAQRGPGDGHSVFQNVLKSTVCILVKQPGGIGQGSGFLLDQQRRWVVTNNHVAKDAREITVYFPEFDSGGKLVTDKPHYLTGPRGIKAEVVTTNPEADLAILKLDSVPAGMVALMLASETAKPGQTVHTIGNPGSSEVFWVYNQGTVRQSYEGRMQISRDESLQGHFLETTNPLNRGDSGGPLVNNRCELVAVNAAGVTKAQQMTICIGVEEVRKLRDRAPK